MKFLLGDCQEAVMLRKFYVIIVLPMPCPDGVITGASLYDPLGGDMSSCWSKMRPDKHPALWELRKLMRTLGNAGRLAAFLELQGATRGAGTSFLGWVKESAGYDKISTQIFAKAAQKDTSQGSLHSIRSVTGSKSLFRGGTSSKSLINDKSNRSLGYGSSAALGRGRSLRNSNFQLPEGRDEAPATLSDATSDNDDAAGRTRRESLLLFKVPQHLEGGGTRQSSVRGLPPQTSDANLYRGGATGRGNMSRGGSTFLRTQVEVDLASADVEGEGDDGDDSDSEYELQDLSVLEKDPSKLAVELSVLTSLVSAKSCRFGVLKKVVGQGENLGDGQKILEGYSFIVAARQLEAYLSYCVQINDFGDSESESYKDRQLTSNEFVRYGTCYHILIFDVITT